MLQSPTRQVGQQARFIAPECHDGINEKRRDLGRREQQASAKYNG
jgi:hypothetical protein